MFEVLMLISFTLLFIFLMFPHLWSQNLMLSRADCTFFASGQKEESGLSLRDAGRTSDACRLL